MLPLLRPMKLPRSAIMADHSGEMSGTSRHRLPAGASEQFVVVPLLRVLSALVTPGPNW
jgi:hypothetical protein